jgi:hypothetical protein
MLFFAFRVNSENDYEAIDMAQNSFVRIEEHGRFVHEIYVYPTDILYVSTRNVSSPCTMLKNGVTAAVQNLSM